MEDFLEVSFESFEGLCVDLEVFFDLTLLRDEKIEKNVTKLIEIS